MMYRRKPRSPSQTAASRLADFGLLFAILVVGALPLVGWALHTEVASWELGLGTAVVLFAGAEIVRELLGRRRRPEDHQSPP